MNANLRNATGAEIRKLARAGKLGGPTAGMAMDYVHANLVILPRDLAADFRLFCEKNPKPCPVLEVTEAGSANPKLAARDADLRTDLPRYCVYKQGELSAEPTDIQAMWRADLVAFHLGCSFTFERALERAGLPLPHLEQNRNVPMYRTNCECVSVGPFHGPLVVSMRPMTPAQAGEAARITSGFPKAHGAPIHIGEPSAIGIASVDHPDYGDAVDIHPGEVPVFWACGVTPQAVAKVARPELLITHKPGHMFVTDWRQ
jgi:uncharacterized protein YcsI (UPF0317 family)